MELQGKPHDKGSVNTLFLNHQNSEDALEEFTSFSKFKQKKIKLVIFILVKP